MTERKLIHVVAGDENWAPTGDELQAIVKAFQDANYDPEGGIVATREVVRAECPIRMEVLEVDDDTQFVGHSALPAGLRAGREWTHTKTNNVYQVITVSNLNSTKPDFLPTVVYRDKDGAVWSRPLSEFVEKFSPPPTEDETELQYLLQLPPVEYAASL